jgi:glutathione S-transferase
MTLRFLGHPLAAYCWKVQIALEEAGLAYDFELVDLGDSVAAAAFRKVSPFGLMPVLVDAEHGSTTFESPIVIEHLARTYPSAARLLPAEIPAALEVRLWDRIFDLHVMAHVQVVVGNRIRPADAHDPFGAAQARQKLRTNYAVLEARMTGRTWAAGDFSMADCAAAPALHYAQKVEPFAESHPGLAAYLARLEARPSFARVLEGAKPYAHMFPAAEPEPA